MGYQSLTAVSCQLTASSYLATKLTLSIHAL